MNLIQPDAYVQTIFGISAESLKKNGVLGLMIDIDNTLVPTHHKIADQKVIEFIKSMKENNIKTIIISNAGKERVERFCAPLGIDYVYKARKPLGIGYDRAIKKMGLKHHQVAIVGDQIFTDVLGGKLKGIKTILTKPIDLNEPIFLKIKRFFEKPFTLGKNYPDKY